MEQTFRSGHHLVHRNPSDRRSALRHPNDPPLAPRLSAHPLVAVLRDALHSVRAR